MGTAAAAASPWAAPCCEWTSTASASASLDVPAAALRTVSTERADTLQVAVDGAMWHFRPEGGSVFRLQWMLEAVMGPRRRASHRAAPARWRPASGRTSETGRR